MRDFLNFIQDPKWFDVKLFLRIEDNRKKNRKRAGEYKDINK